MTTSKYMTKLLNEQFKDLSDMKWYSTAAMWLVSSKFRKYMWMDKFLNKQITNPDERLIEIAQKLRGNNPYEAASKIEEYVIRNFSYVADVGEEWLDAIDVFLRKKDDCDGQNGLIWVLCILAGIDNDMIYCAIGNTSVGKHFWVLFFDARRSRMVKLDATLYPKVSSIANKSAFKLGTKYTKVDFIFNDERIYAFR